MHQRDCSAPAVLGCSGENLTDLVLLHLHIRSDVGGLLARFTDKEAEAWPASGSWIGTQAAALSTETPSWGAGLGGRASQRRGPGAALGLPESQTTDSKATPPRASSPPLCPVLGAPPRGTREPPQVSGLDFPIRRTGGIAPHPKMGLRGLCAETSGHLRGAVLGCPTRPLPSASLRSAITSSSLCCTHMRAAALNY